MYNFYQVKDDKIQIPVKQKYSSVCDNFEESWGKMEKTVDGLFLLSLFSCVPFALLSVISGLKGPEVAQFGCDIPPHPSITPKRLYSDSGRGEICVICSQMACPLSMPAAGVVTGMGTKMASLCLIK